MTGRRQLRLGLVGFGEVGGALGEGLRAEGLEQVVAFLRQSSALRPRRRAAAAGVGVVLAAADLARETDLIVGVTPGTACLPIAEALRPHLTPAHVYVDLAAASPAVKQRIGEILAPTGARLADGAIMGSPLEDGHHFPTLVSGPAAEWFRDAMVPWGMRIQVVGAALGAATGLKSLRSVFTKGSQALLLEILLASRRYGLGDAVVESIGEWMDRRPFRETVDLMLRTLAVHGVRRAAETEMAVEVLRDAGVAPIVAGAAAERLRWFAGLQLEDTFERTVPATYHEVVDAMAARVGAAAPAAPAKKEIPHDR